MTVTLRPARWPSDAAAVSALDTGFVTERIYRVALEQWSFCLVEEPVSPPRRKRYALRPGSAEERRDWTHALVAEEEGRLAGFAAAQFVAWNRRFLLWHLYVAPEYRRQGVGTRLLNALDEAARSAGARCLWLETQTVNAPAIQFYLRSGFRFCGFDQSLYDPNTVPAEEIALFFDREVTPG